MSVDRLSTCVQNRTLQQTHHNTNERKIRMNDQIERLLSRLDKVEQLPPRQHQARYRACCPAHDDKKPSLSITLSQSDTILLRCWSGCSVEEVVGAVGMDMQDLFPKDVQAHHVPKERRPFSADQAAKVVAADAMLTAMVISRVRRGDKVSQVDMDAIIDAHARCTAIARGL